MRRAFCSCSLRKWIICLCKVKVFLLFGKKSLSPILSVSLGFCSGCHDCKLGPPEFLMYLASQIPSELTEKRKLRLKKKELSCLRSSKLLVARKNWNLSQRVGLKSLTYSLFPQLQKTMQSFSKWSFFFFFNGQEGVESFLYAQSIVPHQ